MTAQVDPYTRVYHSIADDSRFESIFDDDAALATWLRLLIAADAAYPTSAPVPRWCRPKPLGKLVSAGLVDLLPRDRYRIHGLAAERAKRSAQGIAGGKARSENAERDAGRFTSASTSDPPATGPALPTSTHQPSEPSNDEQLRHEPTPSKEETRPPRSLRAVAPRSSGSPSQEPRLTREQYASWSGFARNEWQPMKDAWLARGFLYPPHGSDSDDDTTQRGLLWQIAESRPNDLGRWVRDAPGKTAREVIDHVLAQWHSIREDVGIEEEEAVIRKLEAPSRRDAPVSLRRILDGGAA